MSARPRRVLNRALGAAVLVAAATLPAPLAAGPASRGRPATGFRLFQRATSILDTNRVFCGVDNIGQVCVPPFSDGLGNAWPKGTGNQYLYATGLQVAGIIGADGGPWAGDTTGAFFYDTKGTTEHGRAYSGVFNSRLAEDRDNWPTFGTVTGAPFHPSAAGAQAVSEQDLYWLSWEGDPALNAGRPHPLGILVEARALAWNHPAGNDDIIYFVYNFHNITSQEAAAYAQARPEIRPTLLDAAARFHQLNESQFGVTLPSEGYTITDFAPAIARDPDVAQSQVNYGSVIVPLALGFAWEAQFSRPSYWTFPLVLNSSPFFAGAGLAGAKFLSTPAGPPAIGGYSNIGFFQSQFGAAQNTSQLFRYLTGRWDPAVDPSCNTVHPSICYIYGTTPVDVRDYQAAPPVTLQAGGSVSMVVAYVFAAPVADPACLTPCNVAPGDPTLHGDPVRMAAGVNGIDRIAGYLGFEDDDGSGHIDGYEYRSVPRSLYGKAQLAQAFYDHQFLVPQAPAAPDFFLVPGDRQVTVLWRPSTTEETGDPYFDVAKDATTIPPGGTVPTPNPLYDPNFRQFDVEGYRIFRGRTDEPGAMTLIAQFDYIGTSIQDYAGQINPGQFCAPELGTLTPCATSFDPIVPGQARIAHVDIPLNRPIVQVRLWERAVLSTGLVETFRADTVGAGGYPTGLSDDGVPFIYVDADVRNSFRYFYAVTAFDVNSWQSGPGSLESPRLLKPATPRLPATNYQAEATVVTGIYGRDSLLDHTATIPTLDPATGRFSGPFPPSNAWHSAVSGFVPDLFTELVNVIARLDSIRLGAPYETIPHEYWVTLSTQGRSVTAMLPILQPPEIGLRTADVPLTPIQIDPARAAAYGAPAGGFQIPGSFAIQMEGPDYHSLYGRGCINGRTGFTGGTGCAYNGSRWFDGPSPERNETKADPIAGNQANFSGVPMTNYNNAGALTGVTLIHNTQAYQSVGGATYRPMEGIKSGARRAADFNVYWGTGGRIDSVIDVTHNVPVPFAADHLGGTWGILNPSESATNPAGSYDQRPEYTNFDFDCVPPVNAYDTGTPDCAGAVFTLSQTAIPGPVVPFSPTEASARTAPVWPDAGFGLYLSGDIFTFGLAGGRAPSSGTVWSVRTYIGAISGGNGDGGNYGPYIFSDNASSSRKVPRSWTAVGTEVRITFDVVNRVNPATADALERVHPVPDPYYFTSDYDDQDIKFVNLPAEAVIRIYSMSGVLVTLLEHHSTTGGGEASWNAKNRTGRRVAPGVYFYHIESGDARRVGRMLVVNARR